MASPRTSSVYTDSTSAESIAILRAVSNASSIPSSSSRRHQSVSILPSYMNYQNGAPAKRKAVPIASTHIPPTLDTSSPNGSPKPSGALILVIAAEPPKSIVGHITTLLQKERLSSIALVGGEKHMAALKQLKMDLYGLIGRLQLELGIDTYTTSEGDTDGIGRAIEDATQHRKELAAILCIPAYDAEGQPSTELLSLQQDDLERAWRNSFGFVHTVAKYSLSKLESRKSSRGMFLMLDTATPNPIDLANKAACDSLLSHLTLVYASRNVLVDRAERILISEPPAGSNGQASDPADVAPNYDYAVADSTGMSESPTKLWNMWALQDEFPDGN